MARLPDTGASCASPLKDEGELHRVLSDLEVGHAFDAAGVHELYWKLGELVGRWIAEQEQLEVSPVGKALLSLAKNLGEISQFLGGLEMGIHFNIEIAVASRAAEFLALDPTVGSLAEAQKLISSFREDAGRIAHAIMRAHADLPDRPGESGRRALDWYDHFTALLLDIASVAGVEPTLRKDRITCYRSGWLFTAAQALEPFLYPDMRSPSPEACGKRLERSRKRLGERERQKGRAQS